MVSHVNNLGTALIAKRIAAANPAASAGLPTTISKNTLKISAPADQVVLSPSAIRYVSAAGKSLSTASDGGKINVKPPVLGDSSVKDLESFTKAFQAGNIAADYDGDSFVTGDDFDAFVANLGTEVKKSLSTSSDGVKVDLPPPVLGDSDVDTLDSFTKAFEAGNLAADFNGDSFLTGEDFDAFVASLNAPNFTVTPATDAGPAIKELVASSLGAPESGIPVTEIGSTTAENAPSAPPPGGDPFLEAYINGDIAADFNGDGFVTGEDFDANEAAKAANQNGFLAAYETGDIAADFDGNGFVTGEDFDAYTAANGGPTGGPGKVVSQQGISLGVGAYTKSAQLIDLLIKA